MGREIKKIFLVVIILLGSRLFAQDLTIIGGVGNFSFDPASDSFIGAGEFSGHFYPLGRVSFKDQITTTFGYTAAAERDPILRNILSCEMTINAGIVKFSVGPLFSVFNSWDTYIRPGISASLGLEFPGILFLNFRGGATFGSSMEYDYSLETSRIALGFWLPYMLGTLSMTTNKFNEQGSVFTQDELIRFCFRVDIFVKNIPYTVSVEMGYQTISRSYDSTDKDAMHSAFLGFETNIEVKPNFVIIFGAELPIFVWGEKPLVREKPLWYFRAFTGITWSFEKAPA